MAETPSSTGGSREAWITGIGMATSLGEGLDAHWNALNNKTVNVDTTTFAPYVVHPMTKLSFDAQIPKKGDQRQMEAWQRIGTYAAGLALDSAGVKGNTDILSRMDMIVAAGGGERDLAVDSAIINADVQGNAAPGFINERLMNDLRPTLFLAQLSNLLAGNIAVVQYHYRIASENLKKERETVTGHYTDVLVKENGRWQFLTWSGGDQPKK